MAKNPKMVICRNCNTPISKKAAVCPSCGVKNKAPFYRRGWFIFVMIILVIVIAACFIGDNPKNKEEEEVSIEELEDKHNDISETEEAAQEETVSGEAGSASEAVNGIRPEFKEMLDGYEAFCDEYIEFMKKYKSSGNPANMLAEYTDYTARYADTMNKLNELNGSEMSAEEAAYCAEVTASINQKLLEVAVP